MPAYDFKCSACTTIVEVNENIAPPCPTCAEVMVRIWSAPAVKFKGPGFYSTGG
jgi:putative FmdB family regulatory protein